MADHTECAPRETDPPALRVLIAGAGVAGLEAAFALRELAGDRVTVTLLAPDDEFVARPMSVGEPFNSARARRYPLARLASEAGAELVRGALTPVDARKQVARTHSGAELSYDALVACPGATMQPAFAHGATVDDACIDERLHGLVQDLEAGYVQRLAIVIPAPMPWPLPGYELALMSSERAWEAQTAVRVTVLTPEPRPLAVFGLDASREVSRLLAERHVDVITSAYCEIPSEQTIRIHPGDLTLVVDRIVSLPVLRGPAVTGLPHDGDGFIPVDGFGRVKGVDRVWAAGDGTNFPIKHGGVAAQLADTAARSIAVLTGACAAPEPFEPVLEGVLFTGRSARRLRGWPTGGHGSESELFATAERGAQPKLSGRYLAAHLASV